ncbi:MAG: hypothetical protein IPM66_22305 [Acidobacteriota bacterium]|nr:MAG: hypothetical protein IPM66_22305 [Acidobacteriota bacterium]
MSATMNSGLAVEQGQAASSLYHRLIISGRILVPSALHIGSGQASLLTDAAIRRDKSGKPYIPGSSLAGLLRSAAQDFAPYLCENPNKVIERLFGKSDATKEGKFRASYLSVEDASLREQFHPDLEIRDHVGIDRLRAAAQARLKFDQEVSPANTSYEFRLCVEWPTAEEVRLIMAVLEFWGDHGFQIGARTTTGLGGAKVEKESLNYQAFDFSINKLDILKNFLLSDEPVLQVDTAFNIQSGDLDNQVSYLGFFTPKKTPVEFFLPQHLFVAIDLILEEPLLVKSSIPEVKDDSQARTSDAEFITSLKYEDDSMKTEFYVPGSSLKGVLRARAEKIIRTLNFYQGYADFTEPEKDFAKAQENYQHRIAACAVTHKEHRIPRLRACFGNEDSQRTASDLSAEEIYLCSCVTCRIFGNSMMRGRLTCSEATPAASLQAKLFDHVAIDRFTGGAADKKKFDTYPLLPSMSADNSVTTAFTFTLRLERMELWMLGLLGYLLKDLRDGDIRIGHATRRGYGRVRGQAREAVLLAVPGSEIFVSCKAAGLNVEERFGAYTPYRKIDLNDWTHLFGSVKWTSENIEGWRATPGVKLLEEADRAFQERVKWNVCRSC